MNRRPGPAEGSVSAVFLKTVLQVTAGSAGLGGEDLLRGAGIEPCVLSSRASRVSLQLARGVCREAARRFGDPGFGLHVAERLPVGAFDLLDHLAQSCATLGEAFSAMVRHQRLLVDFKSWSGVTPRQHRSQARGRSGPLQDRPASRGARRP